MVLTNLFANTRRLLLTGLFLLSSGVDAALCTQGNALLVEVHGITTPQGQMRIAIYDSPESYLGRDAPLFKTVIDVDSVSVTWDLCGIPPGDYALMTFHDRNANDRFDYGFMGMERESYGFSNNARPGLSPPPFAKASFRVEQGANRIQVELR
ncbi:MAG: DUF2141 domain-containing protein [Pseudomonadota bacterium]|nr:DUF2141 domain-containing protein [Pseudomonadota bacterium]